MIQGKNVLAYIPARSGSKGIKDKNIIKIAGKPLIAYTIEAARSSKYVDKVIVSTDSERYAEIARKWGAEVPFLRPAELAADDSPAMDTTLHLLGWLEKNNSFFDVIFCLLCTVPLRSTEDIDRALEELIAKDADSLIGVSVTSHWMNTLPKDNSMKHFIPPEIQHKNRQEIPTMYQLNGAVFVARRDQLTRTKSWYGERTYPFVIPRERAVDIDEPIDLEFARFLLEKKLREEKI